MKFYVPPVQTLRGIGLERTARPGNILHKVDGWFRVVSVVHDCVEIKRIGKLELLWWRVKEEWVRARYMFKDYFSKG